MPESLTMAAQYLYRAVSNQNEECVVVAFNNIDLDFERTNLFAANGELFERAIRCYHKGVFELLMDHFKKHFLYRQSLEIPQHSADCDDEAEEEEEEDFDDYSRYILPTKFSKMRENFDFLVDLWSELILGIDEVTMAELKRMFAE